MTTVSQALASWLTSFDRADAPSAEVSATRKALINSLGTAVGAFTIDSTQRALDYTLAQCGSGPAVVLVDGHHISPSAATFVNGVMTNALGQEETHLTTGTHPAETTVPTVLALATRYGSSGRAAVDALMIGMQTTMAIASMELTPPVKYELCQAPSVFGTIGAAAAGSRLAGLDEQQAANALGLAAMFASGLAESIRAGTGEYHYLKGLAGQHAVMAVELARTGARSAPQAFEGNGGFYRMFTGVPPEQLAGFDVAGDVLRRASAEWSISDLIYKPYPTNYFNVPFIDAARRLVEEERVEPGDVTSIDIEIGSYASRSGGSLGPPFVHRGSSLASTRFGVCTMLARGRLGLDETLNREDPDVLRLCEVTTVREVAGLTTARLSVRTVATTFDWDLEHDAVDLRLPFERVCDLARSVAARHLGEAGAAKLVSTLADIDDLPGVDVLAPLLTATGGAA